MHLHKRPYRFDRSNYHNDDKVISPTQGFGGQMKDEFPMNIDEDQRKVLKQDMLDQDFNIIFSKSKAQQRKNFKERQSMSQIIREDPGELLQECKDRAGIEE
jgi:hypothetical protein